VLAGQLVQYPGLLSGLTMHHFWRNRMSLTAARDWRPLAACWSADPDLFFPIPESGYGGGVSTSAEIETPGHSLALSAIVMP